MLERCPESKSNGCYGTIDVGLSSTVTPVVNIDNATCIDKVIRTVEYACFIQALMILIAKQLVIGGTSNDLSS